MKKKKLMTTGAAVGLAMLLLIGGGTFAYLQSNSDEVTNNFKTNKVTVDLTETTGQDYNIVPGSTEKKDPTVSVDATVDSYVYVEVKDATDGLVDYEISDGWTALDGFPGVYYRAVTKSDATQKFGVLKDNKVTYSKALENSDMVDGNGNLKEGIKLSFKAYAIQQKGFDNATAAYKQIPSEVTTTEEATKAVAEGKPVQMEKDLTIPVETLADEDVHVDINGKTLTVTGDDKNVWDGESILLENGTVKWKTTSTSSEQVLPVAFRLNPGSDVTLKNVKTDMGQRGIAIAPEESKKINLNIIDSTITTTDNYIISTNAGNTKAKDVNINVKNSNLTVSSVKYDGDNAGIMLNVPGTLNIDNSTITADHQAVIVRCGTANITDSNLVCTGEYPKASWAEYDGKTWGSGNSLPTATLVVGNRSSANVYPYDATCTLSGTTLKFGDGNTGRNPVYAAAYNGHTTTISGVPESDITQSKDDSSTITIQ